MNFRTLISRKTPGLAGLGAASILCAALVALPGCLGQETGISQRHLQGIVTLPPLSLWESEPSPKSEVAEDNNDTIETADGPFSVTYAYHEVRGVVELPCKAIDEAELKSGEVTPDCNIGIFDTADSDFYRLRSGYQGPIAFTGAADEGDIDIIVMDSAGNVLFEDPNFETTETEDEEGNVTLSLNPPYFASQVEKGDEFIVEVKVNAGGSDPVGYSLFVAGNNPNRHNQEIGFLGNTATFETGSDEPIIQDALELKVGAFVSSDIEDMGNPVGGTSCKIWNYDDDSKSFWCAWDMAFLHQVTVEANVLIEGMDDGKDNDCDGTADTGDANVDSDGDGFTVAQGDCNDTDPEVGPYRGDTTGDRKDNDCDGWADNGPDDVDNDGDGYCENGTDLNSDGVCRGPLEVNAGFGTGDCNDQDPAIFPGLEVEISANSIDDDCSGGDAPIDTVTNTDGDFVLEGTTVREWSDQEELACGTNPFDEDDKPVDDDEDGLCDSDCLGTVGCAQDNDGDSVHNWDEVLCGSDPDSAESLPLDQDEDGTCNGKDSDADGDGFLNNLGSSGDDCNDLDASIHPHDTDENGVVETFNYDVANGVDDDCDGSIDENRDWARDGDDFVQDSSYESEDLDGDGYTLSLRDCDDNDPTMHLGNYEVRSANVVNTDFNTVHLFAGDVTSLNNTMEQADARRVTSLVEYDLQKDRVGWSFEDLWEEFDVPPQLQASELPVLEASYAKQPEVGKIWFEATDGNGDEVPNDFCIAGFGLDSACGSPWEEGNTHLFQDLGESAPAGKTNELSGTISSIEADSWAGDNDGYRIVFPEAGYISVNLDWDTAGGDYDMIWYCYFFNAVNPPAYYGIPFDPSLADLSKPEEGTTIVPLPDAAECFFSVVGYAGSPGRYSVQITPQGN